MPRPSSIRWALALVGVCAISYGLGNGWIRLGSPARSDDVSVARPYTPVGAPAPDALDPSALARLEPALEFQRSAPIDDQVRRTADTDPITNPVEKKKAIDEAVAKAKTEILDALIALADVQSKIGGGAALSNDAAAAGRITTAARDAADPEIDKAIRAHSDVVALADAPTPNQITAAFTTASTALKASLPADARKAAEAAIAAMSKTLAGKRETLTAPGDVTITYGDSLALPANGVITFVGPKITFTATVKMSNKNKAQGKVYDDAGARVALELKPRSDSFKPYLKVPPAIEPSSDGNPATLNVTTLESGAYALVVTVTPTDRPAPPPYQVNVDITPDPDTIPRPTIEGLKAMQADRLVTFGLQGTSVIEVGSGRLTIEAGLTQPGRNLAAIDAGAKMVLTSQGGVPVVQPVVNSKAVLSVTIPDDELLDRSKQIAVVDLWSREASMPLTIVIPGDGGRNLPSRTVGISGRTGENAVFAEYTEPRKVPDGFKPSDKVETRVARLYYFRDAHRVAQIVNRDVKSYNRIAVDTRRRMADDARDEADALTDARRIDEIESIQDAQAARAAEQKVRQAQNDLDAAIRAENEARAEAPGFDAALAASEDRAAALGARIEALNGQLEDAKAEDPRDQQKILGLTASISRATTERNEEVGVQSRLKQRKSDAQAIIDGKKAEAARTALDNARVEVEKARTAEATQSNQRVRREQQEDRARENQFRQEVAAAHEDPDTYAPGKPTSVDPVLQVSVSVIGEGLIQLRGPIKGINEIRTMINQIDAPTSQVRVGIHTVQINGEHGDRMEKVATKIQDYVDHSRFLTAQSAQMLRNAVVKVAAMKAQEAVMSCPNVAAHAPGVPCPDDTQEARDARYQEAFFGCDFLNELRAIDSEFLMTGNKLLSLHSMDTTSLASALFLLALAKNDVRMQILDEFQQSMQVDLPAAENNYYAAGAVGRAKDHHAEFKMFACNAKFQSFMGFFNAQVSGSETLNPLQREFLKLAQIFKSRLVTEMEYRQRVTERGLMEDRIDPILDRTKARTREEETQRDLIAAFQLIQAQRNTASTTLAELESALGRDQGVVESATFDANYWLPISGDPTISQTSSLAAREKQILVLVPRDLPMVAPAAPQDADAENLRQLREQMKTIESRFTLMLGPDFRKRTNKDGVNEFVDLEQKINSDGFKFNQATKQSVKNLDEATQNGLIYHYRKVHKQLKTAIDVLGSYKFNKADQDDFEAAGAEFMKLPADPTESGEARESAIKLIAIAKTVDHLLGVIKGRIAQIRKYIDELLLVMADDRPDTRKVIRAWISIKSEVENTIEKRVLVGFDELNESFATLFTALEKYDSQVRMRDVSRRPLDQKRLLDMLIDDVEDKYIELLEGTRSHTANIDAYIKQIATALDDDFNTQFYYPAFTEIRRASRFHDVQLGKIETTNVLANNRGFGKVVPQATMEFDLPKRDILINEAMNGALAMTKDFGALANDPTFLAMAKLRSGQPTSSLTPGAGEGVNTVRNALPGLSRADDEQLFSQQGAGRTQFGSAMEALIPDPAVYKFETGTGFEIRPVVQPDGQSVVFHFYYMYTTNVREPVRADEKHLGRVKRHFIDTDVQLGNYELREVSRYQVALKASRTSRGVPLFEDIPGLGVLFRPLPSAESSLQENIVLGQSTIFPTLFDLMGLRWAPAVADLDTLRLRNSDYIVRGRYRDVQNRVFDISSGQVDEFLQIPPSERRSDLYRSQESIPDVHPNGYRGPGLDYQNSRMREGYDPTVTNPQRGAIPSESRRAAPRTPAPPPSGLIEEGAERPPVDDQGVEGEGAEEFDSYPGGDSGVAAPRADTGDRIAGRPRIEPPRRYTTPAANPAPAARPAPAVAPPARPEPALNGPAATNWRRSAPVAASASPARDPEVGRASFSPPKPQPQPKRQGLFTRMLGGDK
jgi:hypothetical protein